MADGDTAFGLLRLTVVPSFLDFAVGLHREIGAALFPGLARSHADKIAFSTYQS